MTPASRPPRFAWQLAVTGTLRDIFETLERGGIRVAVATDDDGRIVGLMTDGDARRALLSGVSLEAPLEAQLNCKFTAVEPRVSRPEVLELMQARSFDVIPIVDAGGILRGIHRLHDVISLEDRPNWAVIMAGGRGTRLGALTEHVPKPMVRVAGRPILERLVLHLVGHGLGRIYLATNYLGHIIEDHFADGSRFGCSIRYLREERPLGTAGALSMLPETPSDPLLVVNGDLVTQANVGSLLDFHARGRQVATVAVRPYFHTVPFGCLELEGDRVAAIEEKPRLTKIVNAGMYVLSPSVLASLPKAEECTMPGVIEGCLARQELVRAYEIEEDWIDVGQREQLKQARGE
jgi:dTDP-glucose pyrophosphorylase